MTQPTVAWNESIPGPQAAFSQGDNRIREVKTQIREILSGALTSVPTAASDHVMGTSGSEDYWGYHGQVTFMTKSSYPAAVSGAMIFFTYDTDSIAELYCMDENSTLQQLTSDGDFIGGMPNEIRMWSGLITNIPAGWALCDGVSNPTNLLGRFIRGVATASTAPGSRGGNDTGTIVDSNIPTHTHSSVSSSSGGAHVHGYTYSQSGILSAPLGPYYISVPVTSYGTSTGNNTFNHNHSSVTTGSYGGSTTYNNRPAYVDLAFIKRS